jgi:hypothetical protein
MKAVAAGLRQGPESGDCARDNQGRRKLDDLAALLYWEFV